MFAHSLQGLASQTDPILQGAIGVRLAAVQEELGNLVRGRIVFQATEAWRTVYEQILRSPDILHYRSVAWLRNEDYWQDPPGRQSMQVNYDLLTYGVPIERILILCDFFWPVAAVRPATESHIVWDAPEVVDFSPRRTAHVREALTEIRRIIQTLATKRDQRRDAFARVIQRAMETKLGADADQVKAAKAGIGRTWAKETIELAAAQGPFTVFAMVDVLTKLARRMKNAGERTEVDLHAGKFRTPDTPPLIPGVLPFHVPGIFRKI